MEPKQNSNNQPAARPDSEPSQPIDKGWAWMMCLGCHVSHMLSLGYFASLGVFFLEWREYFDASATASSWIASVPWLMLTPGSQIVGILAPRLGVRRLAIVGAIISCIGTILGSLSNRLWHLYLAGALSGLGAGIIETSNYVVVTRNFKKHYAFAMGITLAGINVGQIIFPPLIRLLVTHYGWRGAMFIIGALQMNAAAACALYRPFESYSKSNPERIASKKTIVMEVIPDTGNATSSENATNTQQDCSKPAKGHHGLKGLAFLKPLANVRFTLVILSITVYSLSWVAVVTHLPARAKEAGWSEDQGAVLLTIFAAIGMVARSTHGLVIDRKLISVFKLHLTMLLSAAVATFVVPVTDSYIFLVGYVVVMGISLGISTPLFVVDARTFIGEAQVASAMSWIVTSFSLANGTGSVIAGKLFDATGNYVATFLFIGAFFATAFLLIGAAVVLEKGRELLPKRRQPRSGTSDGNEAGSAK